MNKPIAIPEKLKNAVGDFFDKSGIKPNDAPLLLSLCAFQELYVKSICLGLNTIDKRILKTLKESIKVEFKKHLIDMEQITFTENYNQLRYDKPTMRLVYNNVESSKLIDNINKVLITENNMSYDMVLSIFLSSKIGIALEIDLNEVSKVKDLKAIFELIMVEIRGVSAQRLLDADTFIKGVRFFEINPFSTFKPKKKTITMMCVCVNKNIESFILKCTINQTIKELIYIFKDKDLTKGLNENKDINIGIKLNKVYNREYGQKVYINLE
jgi:hypothetical protein